MSTLKLSVLAAAGLAAFSLAACNKAETGAAPDQSNGAVNAAQDAASAATGAVAAPAGAATTDGFVTNAAVAGMYEIESSKLALQRSNNPKVKELAQKIIDDHTKAAAELKATATGVAGVTIPAALDERHKGLIDNLRGATNADFDRTYLEQQNAAHREAVDLFGGYADGGDNAALKAFAVKTKPALEMHLQMVEALQGAN